MSSKRAEIERLLEEGKLSRKQIALTLKTTPKYVHLVAWDLRNPGILNKTVRDYQRRTHYQKRWRANNPEKRASQRKKDVLTRQNHTRPRAKNNYQRWTIKEIEYLEKNRNTKTIKQLALDLGRTFMAIQVACSKYSITLEKEKGPSQS
ncbi:MAG: hypothetical protein Q8Q06_03905 [bacterium]|nr:hypothetical protein [bacterium]